MKKASLSTKKLVYTATLTAIATIFNIFVFYPAKYFAVSFVALPCFIAGAFLGPVHGFGVGILGDLLGCIIHPQGPYLPLIGIASGLLGFIPGIVFQYFKMGNFLKVKVALSYILTLIICTSGLNTFALWQVFNKDGKSFFAYLALRLPFQVIVSFVNGILSYALMITLEKYVFKKGWSQEQCEKEGVSSPRLEQGEQTVTEEYGYKCEQTID